MFDKKINAVTLSGKTIPIVCDMRVLEQIQEKYSDLSTFEDLLAKFTPQLEESGEESKDKDGNILGRYGIPDIKAINDALYFMACEGYTVSGDEPMERNELLSLVDVSPIDLGIVLRAEFDKCFVRKNLKTTQMKPKKAEN